MINLKSHVSPKDYKYLVPQLVAVLKGPIAADLEQMQLDVSQYCNDDGIEKYLEMIQRRIGLTSLQQETEIFKKYFHQTRRSKGESMVKYLNEDENAYRRLQSVVNDSV